MKKNVLGFAICGLIGLATVFVYKSFTPSESKIDCCNFFSTTDAGDKPHSNESAAFVRQAVFNARTRIFYWELSAPTLNETVDLHFFVRERDKTRYVFSLRGIQTSSKSGKSFIEYNWTGKPDSMENLYVTAERSAKSEHFAGESEPIFDARKAAPVSVFWGN